MEQEITQSDGYLSFPRFIGETKKMNLFQAVNDAMSIAMTTDDTAGNDHIPPTCEGNRDS
jgi:hypothetical protein